MLEYFNINWGFYFDNLTCTNVICCKYYFIFCSFIFNRLYVRWSTFTTIYVIFIFIYFFYVILVTGDNFLILFLGWEGVGLCSYLLISFWYTRIQANKAAIKALIVNRIADFALTIGIVLFFLFLNL